MKTCPFETPLSLSARDRRSMSNIAQRCIDETMADYEHVLASKSGLPVSTRWKHVKRKQNITVYQDQLIIEEIKRRKRKAKSLGELNETARVGEEFSKSVGPGTCLPPAETEVNESTELPKMTWMGTVECELDDLMYGIVSQNDEVTRIKASYSGTTFRTSPRWRLWRRRRPATRSMDCSSSGRSSPRRNQSGIAATLCTSKLQASPSAGLRGNASGTRSCTRWMSVACLNSLDAS